MAVTAFPVVLIDSATGSDSLASGAGPGTALTGTNASTNAGGTVVTLDGSPDLSGVATDGSHVIYLAESTAGRRNFAAINATDNSAKTVTVEQAFFGSLSGKSWAIGGKRASLSSTTSRKLIDNNGASGDAMPGWTIELASGHTETTAAGRLWVYRSGSSAGPITIRGASGAATLPILTWSTDTDYCLAARLNANVIFRDFEMRNTAASKTTSRALYLNGNNCQAINIKISHSTNYFWKGIVADVLRNTIRDCEIGYTASNGIECSVQDQKVMNCFIHNCGGDGIVLSGTRVGYYVYGNIIYSCTTHGINLSASADGVCETIVINQNTIDSNGGSGILISGDPSSGTLGQIDIRNNITSNNSAYGVRFSHANSTTAALTAVGILVDGNATYNNTSGAYLPASYGTNDTNANPSYTNAASGDFSIGTNLKAKGSPLAGTLAIGRSTTYSYVDPGAAQRQEAGGGSAGILVHPGMVGV